MNIQALLAPQSRGSLGAMFTTLISLLALQAADAVVPDSQDAPAEADPVARLDEPAFDADAAIVGINTYLNSISTARARFVQVAPNGAIAEGLLSMSRPGRLRFEYDDPSPIRVISDGTTIAVEDTALETVDRAPLRSTPLWWLLSADADIERDAEVAGIVSEFGFTYLTLRDPDGEMQGEITLSFAEPSYELREWYVTDALGETTRVILQDMETGMRLSPRLFVIRDPDDRRDSRRGR